MKDVHKQYFLKLLKKYRLGNATEEETQFLEAYYHRYEENEDLITAENEASFQELKDAIKLHVDQTIASPSKKTTVKRLIPLWTKYAAAASIVVLLSVSGYFLFNKTATEDTLVANKDVAPGSNRATLTLSNGKKILLDDASHGEIANQSGIRISKTADGQIVYTMVADEISAINNSSTAQLNTISTPNGGKYQIILPDGSTVFLNAASTLTFPAFFQGSTRSVDLSGEAYFEVTKNKDMPFMVNSGGQAVEVLGTHFNIDAYSDENIIKTTLLEGSVRVSLGTIHTLIEPGQQTVVNKNELTTITKRNVDVDKETAWKNNVFSFENDDLKSIMRQISRWYDVEVVYKGSFPEDKFFGEISRNSNLSEVAKILELNNIHLVIQGKKINVSYNQSTKPLTN